MRGCLWRANALCPYAWVLYLELYVRAVGLSGAIAGDLMSWIDGFRWTRLLFVPALLMTFSCLCFGVILLPGYFSKSIAFSFSYLARRIGHDSYSVALWLFNYLCIGFVSAVIVMSILRFQEAFLSLFEPFSLFFKNFLITSHYFWKTSFLMTTRSYSSCSIFGGCLTGSSSVIFYWMLRLDFYYAPSKLSWYSRNHSFGCSLYWRYFDDSKSP